MADMCSCAKDDDRGEKKMFPCSSRRNFLKGFAAGAVVAATPAAFAKAVRLRHDPDLTALLADKASGIFIHLR